jgi:hypothetical protein
VTFYVAHQVPSPRGVMLNSSSPVNNDMLSYEIRHGKGCAANVWAVELGNGGISVLWAPPPVAHKSQQRIHRTCFGGISAVVSLFVGTLHMSPAGQCRVIICRCFGLGSCKMGARSIMKLSLGASIFHTGNNPDCQRRTSSTLGDPACNVER